LNSIKSLENNEKKLFISCYYIFFVNGALALILGAMLPYIKQTYALSYKLTGLMISFHSIGNLISSFIGGILPVYLGRKKSIMLLVSTGAIAFILMILSGNPILLLAAFFLTGINRGAVSNFNNTVINDIATGKAWALNLLHAVFALGAFTSPFIALFFTRNSASNWIFAALTLAFLCFTELIVLFFMKIPNNTPAAKEKNKISWEFLKNKNFLTACAILFFYLSAEQAINGWLVTYFKETGIMNDSFAQSMASLLWIVILFGRLTCAYLSKKIKKSKILVVNGIGYVIFFVILLSAKTLSSAAVGIIGVGFCMAGLYPTTLSSIGNITKKYPLALSCILTCASLGAILMPGIIGTIADKVGIAGGMSVLIIAAGFTVVFIILNAVLRKNDTE